MNIRARGNDPGNASSSEANAIPSKFGIYPTLCEDENFYSYVTRWFHLNGAIGLSLFHATLFGSPLKCKRMGRNSTIVYELFHRLPIDHPYRGRADFVSQMTALPYHLYPHPTAVQKRLLRPSPLWHDTDRLRRVLQSVRSPYYLHDRWVTCIDCLREDVQSIGFSWWRRAHQLPGVGRCHRHGSGLVMGCRHCGSWMTLTGELKMPSLQCRCGNFEPEFVPESEWMAPDVGRSMAKVMVDMLSDPEPIDSLMLRRTLRFGVFERYGGGGARWRDLAQELTSWVRNSYLLCRKKNFAISNIERWCRDACLTGDKQHPVERYVLLTTLLFGSLHDLKEASTKHRDVNASLTFASVDRWLPKSSASVTANDLSSLLHRNRGSFRKSYLSMGLTYEGFLRLLAFKCPDVLEESIPQLHRPMIDEVRRLFREGVRLQTIMERTNVSKSSLIKMIAPLPEYQDKEDNILHRRKKIPGRPTRRRGRHRSAMPLDFVSWEKAAMGNSAFDWEARDEEWSHQVPIAVEALIEKQVHRLTRIRLSTVLIHMRWKFRFGFRAMSVRIPKTCAALDKHCESMFAYTVRRVAWCIRTMGVPGEPLPRRAICSSCSISPRELPAYLWLTGFDENAC